MAIAARVYAQADPGERARRLAAEGIQLIDTGRTSEGVEKLESALGIWLALDNLVEQARVTERLAQVERERGNYDQATALHLRAARLWQRRRLYEPAAGQYRRALEIANATLDMRTACEGGVAIGEIGVATGDFGWAQQNLKDANEVCNLYGDRAGEARAWSALGDLYTRQGQYDLALTALAAAVTVGAEPPAVVLTIRTHLGILYTRQGRLEDAQRELERARDLATGIGDRETEGVVLTALARTYRLLGRYPEARTRLERAVALLQESEVALYSGAIRGLRPLLADAYTLLGEVQLAEQNDVPARSSFESALSVIAVDPKQDVVLRAATDRRMLAVEGAARYNLGVALLALGDGPAALAQLRNVLTIAHDLSDRGLEGRVHSQMGTALHAGGELAQAAKSFEAALQIQADVGDVIGEIATLGYAGNLDLARGHEVEAIDKLRRAVDRLEDVRGSLEATESRIGFLSTQVAVADAMAGLLATLANRGEAPPFALTAAGDDYASAALHYAERARSRAWVDTLARTRGATLRLPPAVESEERALLARRDIELRAYRDLSRDPRETRDRFRSISAELERFIERLRSAQQPELRAYAALRYPVPLRSTAIQSALAPDEVLIEYAIKPTGSVAWIVERDRPVRIVPLSLSADAIARAVKEVRSAFQYRFTVPQSKLEELFRALLEPALRSVDKEKRLIVVPDGPLFSLPFETLGWKSESGWRFVADQWLVSYYPSATLLALTRVGVQPSDGRWKHAVFAMGDPVYPDDSDFEKLAGTRAEVVAIGNALRSAGAANDVRLGADARESAIKEASDAGRLAEYRYVHLAAHGLLTASTGIRQPALVLSQGVDAGEDGFLTMDEVLGLRMNADLVVLSACQTALGEHVPGEGVVGLMRAFFHAGTRSAVVSLWRVDDRSTADLMQHFYRELGSATTACSPSDKVCALNAARTRLRATHPHPYYWAPFVLFGGR